MSAVVDVSFPVRCQAPLPADHGYLLYAALSRLLPALHRENGVAVHPLAGRLVGPRQLQLDDGSRLTLRLSHDRIADILGLAGKQLNLADRLVRIGVPSVRSLEPVAALRSRLVTTKNGQDAEHFRGELRRQLDRLRVAPTVEITLPLDPRRRTLRIKDKEIVGHEVLLEGLSAEESLDVQTHGLGGRRHMGCGVFVAIKSAER
jgi:CRISPR-associated protein Cas6